MLTFDFQRNVGRMVTISAVIGLVSFCIVGFIGFVNQDTDVIRFYFLAGALSGLLLPIRKRINEVFYTKAYLVIYIAISWLAQLMLPSGPEAWVILLPTGYLFLAVYPKLHESLALFAFTVAGVLMIYDLGMEAPVAEAGNRMLYPLVVLALVCFQTYFIILSWSQTSAKIIDHLETIQSELCERVEVGIQQANDIAETNLQLESANQKLLKHQNQVTEINQQLALEQEEQRQIVFAIHQDLREPLRSIVSFIQLIRKRISKIEANESCQEYLEFVEDGGRRMGKMLDDLLKYAEKDENEACQVIQLNVLVDEVLMDLYDARERTLAKIEVGQLPEVLGQYTQIRQLFQNLLANALKFTAKDRLPEIRISSSYTSSSELLICIADNGIGIPEQSIEKIFGLFNRSHSGQGYEGSGVGLALCKRIAIAHGGDLLVSSKVGVGTTFTIVFPKSVLHLPVEVNDSILKSTDYAS